MEAIALKLGWHHTYQYWYNPGQLKEAGQFVVEYVVASEALAAGLLWYIGHDEAAKMVLASLMVVTAFWLFREHVYYGSTGRIILAILIALKVFLPV